MDRTLVSGVEAMPPGEVTVGSIMQKEFASVSPTDLLDFVDDVMKLGQIRHMPVLQDDELIGVVSQRDLLATSLSKALAFDGGQRRNFLRSVQVEEAMSRRPITVRPDVTLLEASRILLAHRIGCLPVVEGDQVVGLITETDLLRGAYGL